MSAQKPSVGRVIHFYAPAPIAPLDGPYAGIVTGVDDDGTTCSITTFGPSGSIYPHQAVPYSDAPEPGHWTWPPRV